MKGSSSLQTTQWTMTTTTSAYTVFRYQLWTPQSQKRLWKCIQTYSEFVLLAFFESHILIFYRRCKLVKALISLPEPFILLKAIYSRLVHTCSHTHTHTQIHTHSLLCPNAKERHATSAMAHVEMRHIWFPLLWQVKSVWWWVCHIFFLFLFLFHFFILI